MPGSIPDSFSAFEQIINPILQVFVHTWVMNPKKKGAILCAILVLDLLVNVAKRHTLSSVNHIHQNDSSV